MSTAPAPPVSLPTSRLGIGFHAMSNTPPAPVVIGPLACGPSSSTVDILTCRDRRSRPPTPADPRRNTTSADLTDHTLRSRPGTRDPPEPPAGGGVLTAASAPYSAFRARTEPIAARHGSPFTARQICRSSQARRNASATERRPATFSSAGPPAVPDTTARRYPRCSRTSRAPRSVCLRPVREGRHETISAHARIIAPVVVI
jgi:hypothetical protein